jgi:hypothetical protein
MNNQQKYIEIKKKRRQSKKTEKRNASYQEVIYIFEKVLEGWKTIRIYNTIIQNDPSSTILKKNVENIATGNSKVYETELSPEDFEKYKLLREKVYQYHIDIKIAKKEIKNILE